MRFYSFVFLFIMSLCVQAEDLAPDFSLSEIDTDKIHELKDYRGKVVYLDFWASWCGPCRQSLPALDKLQKEVGDEHFEVIAINLDMETQEGIDFLKQYPVSYTVLKDAKGQISRTYDIMGLPSSVLISKEGTIVSSFQGFHPSHVTKLKKAIQILSE